MSNYDFALGPAKEPKRSKSRFDRNDDCIEGFHIAVKPRAPRETFPLPNVPNGTPLDFHFHSVVQQLSNSHNFDFA